MPANSALPVELLPANTEADLYAILLGWLAPSRHSGPLVRAYEQQFSRVLGSGKAHAFSGGRVALAAILDALGVGSGDEVIVPAYTCVAVPNPILFRGAIPVYADIDPSTLNLDPADIERKLSPNTKALLVQHTFGYPAPIGELVDLARRRGLAVIEDCTHALGATLAGKQVGTYGHAAFFSSEQTKIISTGAGGVAYSEDPELTLKMADFARRCGMPDAANIRKLMAYLAYIVLLRAPTRALRFNNADYYLQRLGLMKPPQTTTEEMRCERPKQFELRLSGAQARVGSSQLANLQHNLERRRKIAAIYFEAFAGKRVRTFAPPAASNPAFVRFPLQVKDKAAFAKSLAEKGIQVGLWFTAPIHPVEVPQARAGYSRGSCPHAEWAVAEVANLPCHPRMTDADALRIAEAVLECKHA